MTNRYVCPSNACRREVEIEITADRTARETLNPKCICGAEMKKIYSKPVLFSLSKEEAIHRFGDFGEAKAPWIQTAK